MTPSPKVLWRTESPGLNCWPAGFVIGGGEVDGFEGMLGAGVGRGVHCGAGRLACGLPEPKTRPESRPYWRSWLKSSSQAGRRFCDARVAPDERPPAAPEFETRFKGISSR